VCAVELPGHGRRLSEPPIAQIEILIQRLSASIQTWLDKPFVFFGHSLGALIAFELARSLQQQQFATPDLLWVSAARAPHLTSPNSPIHQLASADFIAELSRYSGTPAEVLANAELMELLLPMLRADFALLETYCYREQPPLTCPISAFWGEHDAIVSSEEVEAWHLHTNQMFSLKKVNGGDHFFIHQPSLLHYLMTQLPDLPRSRLG
jgi:medium-chain acyl-[acyl-carrier-protein] hydrolase